jgi:hypothetical protein
MGIYNICTTVELARTVVNEDGKEDQVKIPIGAVVNSIIWDGISPWVAPENTEIVKVAD